MLIAMLVALDVPYTEASEVVGGVRLWRVSFLGNGFLFRDGFLHLVRGARGTRIERTKPGECTITESGMAGGGGGTNGMVLFPSSPRHRAPAGDWFTTWGSTSDIDDTKNDEEEDET